MMAAMTTSEEIIAALDLGNEVFVKPSKTATVSFTVLRNVIRAIDDTMIALASTLTGTDTIEIAISKAVDNVQTGVTVPQKSLAIQAWVRAKHGTARV